MADLQVSVPFESDMGALERLHQGVKPDDIRLGQARHSLAFAADWTLDEDVGDFHFTTLNIV
jgi:hypothetical protein